MYVFFLIDNLTKFAFCLLYGLAFCLLYGLAFCLLYGLAFCLLYGLAFCLLYGLAFCLLYGLAFCLLYGLACCLLYGLAFCLLYGLAFCLLYGLQGWFFFSAIFLWNFFENCRTQSEEVKNDLFEKGCMDGFSYFIFISSYSQTCLKGHLYIINHCL